MEAPQPTPSRSAADGRRRVARVVVGVSAFLVVGVSLAVGRIEDFRIGTYDEQVYRIHARNLIDHGFYGYDFDRAEAYRAPGYTFFAVAVRRTVADDQTAVRVVQSLLAGLTVMLAAGIARRLFGDAAAAVAAVLLLAVGTIAAYAALELSETFATTTLVAGVAAGMAAAGRGSAAPTWLLAALGGILLGASILTRPQALLLVLPLGIVLGVAAGRGGRRWFVGLAFALATVATIAPWTIRNYLRLQAFVPVSTYGGVNLYLANNENADGRFRPVNEFTGDRLYQRILTLPEAEQDREWYRLAVRFIRERPGRAVANWFHDAWLYLTEPDDLVEANYHARESGFLPRLDDRLLWLLAVPGMWVAIGRERRRRLRSRALAWVPGVVVLYHVAFFMLFLPLARFRHGVVPFLAIYAGAGLAALGGLLRSRGRVTAAAASREVSSGDYAVAP